MSYESRLTPASDGSVAIADLYNEGKRLSEEHAFQISRGNLAAASAALDAAKELRSKYSSGFDKIDQVYREANIRGKMSEYDPHNGSPLRGAQGGERGAGSEDALAPGGIIRMGERQTALAVKRLNMAQNGINPDLFFSFTEGKDKLDLDETTAAGLKNSLGLVDNQNKIAPVTRGLLDPADIERDAALARYGTSTAAQFLAEEARFDYLAERKDMVAIAKDAARRARNHELINTLRDSDPTLARLDFEVKKPDGTGAKRLTRAELRSLLTDPTADPDYKAQAKDYLQNMIFAAPESERKKLAQGFADTYRTEFRFTQAKPANLAAAVALGETVKTSKFYEKSTDLESAWKSLKTKDPWLRETLVSGAREIPGGSSYPDTGTPPTEKMRAVRSAEFWSSKVDDFAAKVRDSKSDPVANARESRLLAQATAEAQAAVQRVVAKKFVPVEALPATFARFVGVSSSSTVSQEKSFQSSDKSTQFRVMPMGDGKFKVTYSSNPSKVSPTAVLTQAELDAI